MRAEKTRFGWRQAGWLVLGLLGCFLLVVPVLAATLLPNGEQVFVDANGQPLGSGKVYFYIPATLTPKNTWIDAAASVLNANPVLLDAAGRAIIYGSGNYRQIVKDQFGNTIWDQLTSGYGVNGSSGINTTITGSGAVAACIGLFPINNGTGSPITLTMPAAPNDGDNCSFLDVGNNSGANYIGLNFGAKTLNLGGNSAFLNSNGMTLSVTWMATAATWVEN